MIRSTAKVIFPWILMVGGWDCNLLFWEKVPPIPVDYYKNLKKKKKQNEKLLQLMWSFAF